MELTIEKATVGDVPALAQINCSAYMTETIAQFAYKHWPDDKNSYEFFRARLLERILDPNTQIFKASNEDGKVLGFVCWTLEFPAPDTSPIKVSEKEKSEADMNPTKTSDESKPTATTRSLTPTSRILKQLPPYFNAEFVTTTAAEVEQLMDLMQHEQHYYLSAFAVLRGYQGQGVGSQLLKHCLENADQERLRTWLISFPGSHSLYLRFGFKDVDHRDVDLAAWDKGRMRGYGVYRQYAMMREASHQSPTP